LAPEWRLVFVISAQGRAKFCDIGSGIGEILTRVEGKGQEVGMQRVRDELGAGDQANFGVVIFV
jgi:hypothetical protein